MLSGQPLQQLLATEHLRNFTFHVMDTFGVRSSSDFIATRPKPSAVLEQAFITRTFDVIDLTAIKLPQVVFVRPLVAYRLTTGRRKNKL